MKCKICNNTYKSIIYHYKSQHNKTEHEARFFKIKSLLSNKDVSDIIELYEKGYSVNHIKRKYNIIRKDVEFILNDNNIELRNLKDSMNQSVVRDKINKTIYDRYGVSNVSKSNIIKDKKRKTFLKNYGVDNIFKNDEFKDSLNNIMIEKYGKKRITNPDKYRETISVFSDDKLREIKEKTLKSYPPEKRSENMIKVWNNRGHDEITKISEKISKAQKKIWDNMCDDVRNERISKLQNINVSKLEKRIEVILYDLCLEYVPQYKIKNKYFDFLLKDTNILIEVNGDFWHGNPKIYEESDVLLHPIKTTAGELWKKDRNKYELAKKKGFKVVYLWETDINKMNDLDLSLFISELILNVSEN